MNKTYFLLACLFAASLVTTAQERWQQRVKYEMEIDMDAANYRYEGVQKATYFNNSPDTLYKVYYHLAFNAFQPGSMMDVRSRSIVDPDRRIQDRISKLNENEIGYQKIHEFEYNGKPCAFEVNGTVMEVTLPKPILPGKKATFEMKHSAQVPVQIRRSGRNNSEGVDLSMTQWYPKIAEYDHEGWHADEYIAREFHGVWGDFDVKISIDKIYTIGGTGYLQNPQEVGHGYENPAKALKKQKGDKLTWHFYAPNVHDFAWGADPNFVHKTHQIENGPMLHLFYLDEEKYHKTWSTLPGYAQQFFDIMKEEIGAYPYEQYSVIQGGDGGMEYAMCTLMMGGGSEKGLAGLFFHEAAHSWFQQVVATNETTRSWMDEGFTSWAEAVVYDKVFEGGSGKTFFGEYSRYNRVVKSGLEEPMNTHADFFDTNAAYGAASYGKGSIFVQQLGYIIGKENLHKTMQRYYSEWQFKHPTEWDFIRIAEKVSGMELKWYLHYWVNTTKTIDYAVSSVEANGESTVITLANEGQIPMPLDVWVVYTDGTKELYNIPLRMMRGHKPSENAKVLEDWPWVFPEYEFEVSEAKENIQQIVIDPTRRMADVKPKNNAWPEGKFIVKKGN